MIVRLPDEMLQTKVTSCSSPRHSFPVAPEASARGLAKPKRLSDQIKEQKIKSLCLRNRYRKMQIPRSPTKKKQTSSTQFEHILLQHVRYRSKIDLFKSQEKRCRASPHTHRPSAVYYKYTEAKPFKHGSY